MEKIKEHNEKVLKKIMLVVPNFRWGVESTENTLWHYIPYNLCLLAAELEKAYKYDIRILDAFSEDMSLEAFRAVVQEEKPDYVGLSVLMDFYGKSAHLGAEEVRKVDPDIATIVGGVYATANPERVISDKNIDYVICGEGEVALPALLQYINKDETRIPKGVWYKNPKGEIVQGGHSDLITNLDDYPLPAYHLIDYPLYSAHAERKSIDGPADYPYARIFSSRGCPYNCCFCQVERIAGRKFRPRSAENVLKEIDWLVKDYGIKSFLFDDDNLLTDKNRAMAIFKGMVKHKIKWKMGATAAFLLDNELIELLKESGCIYVDLAIESGCERILHDIIQKPLKLDKALAVIKKLKEEGIFVAANFIIGFPGETWEEIRQTVKYAEDCGADYIKLFNAVPLPNTRLYDLAVKENALIEGFDSENINWRNGMIETDEFSATDLTILRAYEWDRINFSTKEKRESVANMMGISVEELNQIRKRSRKTLAL